MAPRPDEKAEAEDDRSRTGRIKDFAYEKTPEKLKNATDLQVRFRTGCVYVALSVLCILVSDWTTVAFLVATAGITAGEFYYMLRSDAKLPNEMLGIIAAMLYPLSVFLLGLNGALYVSLALLLALIVWYVFWMRARVPDVGVSFFGAAYCGMLLSGLVVVRTALPQPWGGVLALGIFLSVWANDSFAYLVGSKFGKHKLAPVVSPNKTVEGAIGGVIGSVVIGLLATIIYSALSGRFASLTVAVTARHYIIIAAMGAVASVLGILGDLFASAVKRQVGIKDYGTIFPGHGGILDRFDSVMFIAPLVSIVVRYFLYVFK